MLILHLLVDKGVMYSGCKGKLHHFEIEMYVMKSGERKRARENFEMRTKNY